MSIMGIIQVARGEIYMIGAYSVYYVVAVLGGQLFPRDHRIHPLAPVVIDNLAEAITDINRSGISVLLVEQNAGLVTRVSRRCYVIEVGRVVLEGEASDLTANNSVRKASLG